MKEPVVNCEKLGTMRSDDGCYSVILEMSSNHFNTFYDLLGSEDYNPDGAWSYYHIDDNEADNRPPFLNLSEVLEFIENAVKQSDGKLEFTFDPAFALAHKKKISKRRFQ